MIDMDDIIDMMDIHVRIVASCSYLSWKKQMEGTEHQPLPTEDD